jgi:hypothetical protein
MAKKFDVGIENMQPHDHDMYLNDLPDFTKIAPNANDEEMKKVIETNRLSIAKLYKMAYPLYRNSCIIVGEEPSKEYHDVHLVE